MALETAQQLLNTLRKRRTARLLRLTPPSCPIRNDVTFARNVRPHTSARSPATTIATHLALMSPLCTCSIQGGELFERVIDDDFVLTEKACAVFMRQICEGMEYIHSRSIIHLDMKVSQPQSVRLFRFFDLNTHMHPIFFIFAPHCSQKTFSASQRRAIGSRSSTSGSRAGTIRARSCR